MYYHGSPKANLKVIKPNLSRHGKPYVYLCSNKVHAILYTVKCHMYPYGFHGKGGLLVQQEPFEGYLKEIYSGESGYIYRIDKAESISPMKDIPSAYVTRERVEVASVEFIEDVYQKLYEYESNGLIEICPYDCMSEKSLNSYRRWATENLVKEEFFNSTDEYPMFLKEKFPKEWSEACRIRRREGTEITYPGAGDNATRRRS